MPMTEVKHSAFSFNSASHSLVLKVTSIFASIVVFLGIFWGGIFTPIPLLEKLIGHSLPWEVFYRMHLLEIFSLMSCLFAYLYYEARTQYRPIYAVVLVACLILMGVWTIDVNSFRGEESAITYFTALVLTLIAFVAFYNSSQYRGKLKGLWVVLGLAFLFASLDEVLEFHEKVSSILLSAATYTNNLGGSRYFPIIESLINDSVTLLYGAAALFFLCFFAGTFKREYLKKNNLFFPFFAAAVIIYVLSVLLDSLDIFLEPLFPYIKISVLMNMVEEVFEFTAACMFLIGFAYAIPMVNMSNIRLWTAKFNRNVFPVLAVVLSIGFLSNVLYLPAEQPFVLEANYDVQLFADNRDGLVGIDGLLYQQDYGVIVGDEEAERVLAFDGDGQRVLVDSNDGLGSPESFAFHDGILYISDDSNSQVLTLQADGTVEALYDRENNLVSPDGLAFDDVLYIADEATSSIYRQTDTVLASRLTGLWAPEEMVFLNGNLYVTDEDAGKVFVFNKDGDRIDEVLVSHPEGIASFNDAVYVSSTDGVIYDLFRQEEVMHFSRKYKSLSGITFDESGNLYVASFDRRRGYNYIFKVSDFIDAA